MGVTQTWGKLGIWGKGGGEPRERKAADNGRIREAALGCLQEHLSSGSASECHSLVASLAEGLLGGRPRHS